MTLRTIQIMPRKKSYPVTSLKKLCADIFSRNLNTLQHAAKCLPKSLINDLYDKCCEDIKRLQHVIPPLPADLFLHSRTKVVHNLDIFDQPIDEIVDKISRVCKNLRSLYLLYDEVEHISAITINNPPIFTLTLDFSTCMDNHLSIISKQCPRLRHLSLFGCSRITDQGINFLPRKLISLFLPMHITLKGQLNALERLRHLKLFFLIGSWNSIIEAYVKSFANRVGNRTYQIRHIYFYEGQKTLYDIAHTVGTLFPKLSEIYIYDGFYPSREITFFCEAINSNLLTQLALFVSPDFIQIAAHLCPMLKVFELKLGADYQTINDRYLAQPKKVPFKCLRELKVWNQNSTLLTDDLKLLLVNCQQLESLNICRYAKLSDEFIYDVLAANPLKCLKSLKLGNCEPFTTESLCVLLSSLDSLGSIRIQCSRLSVEDEATVRKIIGDKNWDINLRWDNGQEPFLY